MELYCKHILDKGVVLCVDIYCDGIALPNGGSQTVTPLLVRFTNIMAIETKWFEIGLCPTLHISNTMCTATKLTELRSELLKRYLLIVLRPFIESSRIGFPYASTVIFPRILMVLCDQKQERPLVSLKSSNSTRDCTTCDMVSRITTAGCVRRDPQRSAPPVKKKSALKLKLSNGVVY